MDPNELLRRMLDAAHKIRDEDADEVDGLIAFDLAACVLDLDEWLHKGGFIPTRWDEGTTVQRRARLRGERPKKRGSQV